MTSAMRSATSASAGSTFRPAPAAHAAWFGHPAQLDAFPASADDDPTHPEFAFAGTSRLDMTHTEKGFAKGMDHNKYLSVFIM